MKCDAYFALKIFINKCPSKCNRSTDILSKLHVFEWDIGFMYTSRNFIIYDKSFACNNMHVIGKVLCLRKAACITLPGIIINFSLRVIVIKPRKSVTGKKSNDKERGAHSLFEHV